MKPLLKAFIAGAAFVLLNMVAASYADSLPEWAVPSGETGQMSWLLALSVILGWFVPNHFLGVVAGIFAATFLFVGGFGGFLSEPFPILGLLKMAQTFVPIGVGWFGGRTAVIRFGLEDSSVNQGIGIALLAAAMVSPPLWFLWDARHRVPLDDFAKIDSPRAPRRITPAWTLRIGKREVGAPVAIRGRVFATADRTLHAINSDGSGAWMLPNATTQPSLHDGRLYAGFETGLARIDPDSGATVWNVNVPTGGYTDNSGDTRRRLSVGASGVIYVNPENETLYAINPDGSQRWSFRHDNGDFVGAPVEGTSGRTYVASITANYYTRYRRSVCAIDTNGKLVWEHRFSGSGVGPVAVDRAERVYVQASEYLFALAPDGSERWRRRFVWDSPQWPIVDPKDNVVTKSFYNDNGWSVVAPDGRARHAMGYGGTPLFDNDLTIIAGQSVRVFRSDGSLVEALELVLPEGSGERGGEVALGPEGMLYLQTESSLVALQAPWRR